MVLIYGEALGRSELARQIYHERFPQRILPNTQPFVNVVQHFRDFGFLVEGGNDTFRSSESR
jgi:hypothetical protein